MLSYLTPGRRRAENRRVQSFLYAIRYSGLDLPTEQQTWPAERTDTVAFPRIILAGTVLGTALALSACGSAVPTLVDPSEAPHVVQPVVPEAPVALAPEELTGTDAGLITEPAPTVYELEAQDAARAAVRAPAPVVPPAPVPPATTPAPIVEPAPVVVAEEDGQQDADEVIGSYRCEDVTMVVVAINSDGSWDCQVPA
jgi:hypothetical protein